MMVPRRFLCICTSEQLSTFHTTHRVPAKDVPEVDPLTDTSNTYICSCVCGLHTYHPQNPVQSPLRGDPFPAGRFITCATHMCLMQLMWSTHPHQPSQCTRLHEGPFRRAGPSSPSQSQTHPPLGTPMHVHVAAHTHQRHAIGANLTDAAIASPLPTPTHTHVSIIHLPSSGPYACHLPSSGPYACHCTVTFLTSSSVTL